MNTMQLINLIFTLIFLVWMFAALALWFLMWRNTTMHNRRMTQTLIDAAMLSAQAANKAAEGAQKLATILESVHHAD